VFVIERVKTSGSIHLKNNASQPEISNSRPTLLSKPRLIPLAATDVGEESILSSSKMGLLGNKPRNALPKRKGLKLFAVLGVLAAAAILGYQYLSTTSVSSTLASTLNNTAAKASLASAMPSGVPPDAASHALELAAQQQQVQPALVGIAPEAAQIVNEPHQSAAVAPTTGEAKLTAALEDGVKLPASAVKAALENPVDAAALSQSLTNPKAEKITALAEKKALPISKTRTASTKKPPAEPLDKDVNLLAALIQHNSGVVGTSGPMPRTPAIGKTSASLLPKTNALDSPAPGKMARVSSAPAREVVERQGSESTTALLQRCGALGFIEGELCRVRICSGLWDTDAACKARLSSNASTATDNPKH
jgi:hypothetical protein